MNRDKKVRKILLITEKGTPGYSFSHPFYLLITYCSIVLFLSCKENPSQYYHPEYFDSIYQKIPLPDSNVTAADIQFLDASYNAFVHPGIGDIYRKYNYKRHFFYDAHRDYQRGMLYCDSIIDLLYNYTSNKEIAWYYADAIFVKGDILMHTQKFEESMRMYLEGKNIVLNLLKDSCLLNEYNGRVGKLLYEQGDFLESAKSYKAGFNDQQKCKWDNARKFASMQEYLDNIGICYSLAGMYDSADLYFSSTLDFIDRNKGNATVTKGFVTLAKAVVYSNQAEVAGKKGNFQMAEELFLKSIEGTANVDHSFTHDTQLKLVSFYFRNNYPEKAAKVLTDVKSSLGNFPDDISLLHWYQHMKYYALRQHKPGDAVTFMKLYLRLKDSVEMRDMQIVARDISNEFETIEQKSLRRSLESENKRKSVFIAMVITFCVLTGGILLLLWYNIRRSHRFAGVMTGLNKEIGLKNQDLQEAFNILEQTYNENSKIIRAVSFNLKSHIANIIRTTARLQSRQYSREIKNKLDIIENTCANSLQTISEMTPGVKTGMKFRMERTDLAVLLEQCVELLRSKAEEKNQSIRLRAESIITKVDTQRFMRAINNLLHNSVKFSPDHSVIEISLEKEGGVALVSVLDKGIGIPDEIKENIFSLNTAGSRRGTSGEESYGMGLFITKKVVDEHHGRLWFSNRNKGGTAFYIEIPLS
ncbi:MAG: HAMP domain-containing histidine kinase [Chitinophagaceae bacterium]|nr:HAMP domain-containing histidine kinase [Chitinophagaceae bacterium]